MGGREKGKLEKAEGRREKVGGYFWVRIPPSNQTARAHARTNETRRWLGSPPTADTYIHILCSHKALYDACEFARRRFRRGCRREKESADHPSLVQRGVGMLRSAGIPLFENKNMFICYVRFVYYRFPFYLICYLMFTYTFLRFVFLFLFIFKNIGTRVFERCQKPQIPSLTEMCFN